MSRTPTKTYRLRDADAVHAPPLAPIADPDPDGPDVDPDLKPVPSTRAYQWQGPGNREVKLPAGATVIAAPGDYVLMDQDRNRPAAVVSQDAFEHQWDIWPEAAELDDLPDGRAVDRQREALMLRADPSQNRELLEIPLPGGAHPRVMPAAVAALSPQVEASRYLDAGREEVLS